MYAAIEILLHKTLCNLYSIFLIEKWYATTCHKQLGNKVKINFPVNKQFYVNGITTKTNAIKTYSIFLLKNYKKGTAIINVCMFPAALRKAINHNDA